MAKTELEILQRALERERKARKAAEAILEDKSRELFLLSQQLEQQNEHLKDDLSTRNSELQGVFDNLVDAYVMMQLDGYVIDMNKSAIELFGYDPAKQRLQVAKWLLEEDMEYAFNSYEQLIREGSFTDYRAQVRTKDKGIRNVHINASLIKDSAGNPIAAQGIVRDITEELKLAAEKEQLIIDLEQKNQDLNDFAHIISHDLKSPLRAMDTLINWLKDDHGSGLDAEGQKTMNLLLEKVHWMDQLISGVLEYSRADQVAYEEQQVALTPLIQQMVKHMDVPSGIQIDVQEDLPELVVDRSRMHQLFQNLIGNAVRYTGSEQGQIKLSVEETEAHWLFALSDTGIGIAQEYHDKIFGVFESLEQNDRSTGIGLSIVKKIVSHYGGTIWLKSELGSGTTFFFTLSKTLTQ